MMMGEGGVGIPYKQKNCSVSKSSLFIGSRRCKALWTDSFSQNVARISQTPPIHPSSEMSISLPKGPVPTQQGQFELKQVQFKTKSWPVYFLLNWVTAFVWYWILAISIQLMQGCSATRGPSDILFR